MAKDLKVSVITTVLNEQDTITPLLNSLAAQTTKPAEIIIVDAGSSDDTTGLIRDFAKSHKKLNIKLIVKKGANRSDARNLAIAKAKHQIIAVTDAGCTPHLTWLAKITAPITSKKADSVAGYYNPIANTPLKRAIAPYLAVMPDKLDSDTFLPSSRSVAFSKDAWQKAGKYPKNLNYCEDLVFAQNLKDKTNMTVESKALVGWQLPSTLPEYFKSIKNYALGDLEAGYRRHLLKIYSVPLRYFIFYLFPLTLLPYLIWSIYKHYNHTHSPQSTLLLPVVQLTTDFAIATALFTKLIT